MVAIICVGAMRPGIDDVEDQVVDGREDVAHAVRRGLTAPPTITRLAYQEHSQLCHNPDNDGSERAGDNQSRNTAESGLGDGVEGGILVVLAVELDGLESAHITGNEGEDGHTDTALDEDTEKGPLKHARRRTCG